MPEEVNPKCTTTESTKEETSALLTLNYELEKEANPIDILADTEIKDDILKTEQTEISQGNLIEIPIKNGIETGIEILYTSMKLKNFPIKDSNISSYENEVEKISLNSTTIYIGETPIPNTNIKIIGFNKFKIIEFRTREFKFGISIKLENNTIIKDGDYFRYEIFSKLKNSRLLSVVELLKNFFSGHRLTFTLNDLAGDIFVENPIQSHKFGMIIESFEKYKNIESLLSVSKSKSFSETNLDFYTIHLFDLFLKGQKVLNSWINFRIENKNNIKAGDSLVFSKIHTLDFKGVNYNLKELIFIKDKVSEKDMTENNIVGYRKLVEIQLEEIKK